MSWLRTLVILAFVVIFLIWAGQNLQNIVTINGFSGAPFADAPLWMVVLAAAAFGIFFMGVLGIVQELRDKAEIRRLNRKIENLQEEISSLRNIPISEDIAVEPQVRPEPEPEEDLETDLGV